MSAPTKSPSRSWNTSDSREPVALESDDTRGSPNVACQRGSVDSTITLMKRARVRGLVLTLWSILLAVGACQSDPPRCVPNASTLCACIDGRQGAQRCNARGELEPCVCRDVDAGAPPDGADVPLLDSDVSDAVTQADARLDATDATAATDAQGAADGGAMFDALDAHDADDRADVFVASDTGTPFVDSGVPAPDVIVEPPVDASGESARITGGFTSAAGASAPELSGSFSWSATVYATGGGITLEGSFQ